MLAFLIIALLVLAIVFVIVPWVDKRERYNRADRRERWRRPLDKKLDEIDSAPRDDEVG